ncbi:MAG: family 78 glycoside hydrolase catalytic domain, partial [Bacteroidota bacterium]
MKLKKTKYWILLITIFCVHKVFPNITPGLLTCEYIKNPTLVDVKQPRLGWINTAKTGERGQFQTAWQIRVASTKEQLTNPDLWDSGKIDSDASFRIEYRGKTLKSRQDCWWQVRVWDNKGEASEWSEVAYWHMGLLKETDWKAKWIGAPWQGEAALPMPQGGPDGRPEKFPPPAPLLRKSFNLNKEIANAVVYVTGLGYFEFYLNGKKVGDDVLVPNQTNYGKRSDLPRRNIPLEDNFKGYKVMYLAYDITDKLQKGENVIGSILGNGFYNPAKYWAEGYGSPRFLGQLHITYTDGSEELIVSDQTWKAAKSAIMMDMVYYGEHYDARNEQPGWNSSGFDDTVWENAALRKAPEGKLVAHTAHPDKVVEKLSPVKIEKLGKGNYRVDFGVEISGWLRLNEVLAKAGHKVTIKYISNLYSGDNSYTFRGEGPESYAARFNWFVFSAVEISNWPGKLKSDQLTAEVVNTYIEASSKFETSNQLFNDIHKIWKRSQTDNMHGGIASDCPHRERSGYTGDGQVACVTVMHNYDARNFYHKWVQDMLESQNVTTGYVPNGAPWQPGCGGGVAWGAAINIIPWEYYLHYGALDMLEDNYTGMKEYIRYMQTWVDKEGIMESLRVGRDGKMLKWFNLGEWCTPEENLPNDIIHTFYFWRCADLTAKAASVLGKKDDALYYTSLANRTKKAFHKKYYDEESGSYGNRGGNIFALKMGIPQEQYNKVVAALKANINANKGHLDTGIFGTQFFFEVLSENGMHELAFEAINKTDYPSFGFWLKDGATTTREKWDNSGSHNHPMFGGGIVWFYRKLAGMHADEYQPGYKHIIFKPQPVGTVTSATYENLTSFGKAGISWEDNSEKFTMNVSVPVGSKATVYIPSKSRETIEENSSKPENDQNISFDR